MKPAIFTFLLSLAFQGSAFAQLQITPLDAAPDWSYWEYSINPDENGSDSIVFSYDGPCSINGGHAGTFEAFALLLENPGDEVTVTYEMSLVCGGSSIDDPYPGIQNQTLNNQILGDWFDLGQPDFWSGEVTIPAGFYSNFCGFFQLQGSIGTTCDLGVDTDGDGVEDCQDGCPEDPYKTDPGACGCGIDDFDIDNDGVADCNDGCPNDPYKMDPGLCGCGVSEQDPDGDGYPDCIDNCPNDPYKIEPGNCGCNFPETDVFGDLDCDGDYDIDDIRLGMTNFGIEEAEEDTCPADVDGDGSIGFSDVLIILNDWGACP